jgi:hypothetical protein
MEVYCIEGQEHYINEPTPVITGEIYHVIDNCTCRCGMEMYNVGLAHPDSTGTMCSCGNFIKSSIAWKRASRFVPIDSVDIVELIEESELV